jgi:hypothetical protein
MTKIKRSHSRSPPNANKRLDIEYMAAIRRPAGRHCAEVCRHLPSRRILELLLGAAPSGERALTIAMLTIVSQFELSVSVVYTANPLSRDGVSIGVGSLRSRLLRLRG